MFGTIRTIFIRVLLPSDNDRSCSFFGYPTVPKNRESDLLSGESGRRLVRAAHESPKKVRVASDAPV